MDRHWVLFLLSMMTKHIVFSYQMVKSKVVIHQWKAHEELNMMVAKILKNNIILFSKKMQKRTYMKNFKQVLTILLLSTLRAEKSASTGDSQE